MMSQGCSISKCGVPIWGPVRENLEMAQIHTLAALEAHIKYCLRCQAMGEVLSYPEVAVHHEENDN